MAALMRLVGPAVARYFDPGPDDLIDSFFDGTPMPVTIEVYPFYTGNAHHRSETLDQRVRARLHGRLGAEPCLAPVQSRRRRRRNRRRHQYRESVGDRRRWRNHPLLAPLFPHGGGWGITATPTHPLTTPSPPSTPIKK